MRGYEGIVTNKESSFWLETSPKTNFPILEEGLKVDVTVIGGGITGITTATLLKESGLTVAVIESDRIVKDVTSGTTAKISAAPNMIYADLISNLGEDKAQKFAKANMESVEKIADLVRENNIDCDFHRLPLYIYTELDEKVGLLQREFKAAIKLGLKVSCTKDVPLSFISGPALKYENQAQFHPRKYLLFLAENLTGDGSYVFEKTRSITINDGEVKEVCTDHGSIKADKVIVATHKPVYDHDKLYDHLQPARSYVLGLYARENFPDGLFVDFDPVHTYRTAPSINGKMILVAGEHSSVDVPDKNIYYNRLEKYARQHLDVESIEYRWTSKDIITDDGLPIIGMTSQDGIYVATGFGFWGMTNGTTAAMVITDLINGIDNEFINLFNPLRFKNK
jgi:glycine/D-amino acid oxidase-like deaminating enzyme